MQISKSFLVVCAATIGIVPLCLPAADTEAQIRAREALEKKLNEIQTQEPTPQPKASTPKKSKKEATEAQPASTAQPTTPAPTTEPAPAVAPATTTEPAATPANPSVTKAEEKRRAIAEANARKAAEKEARAKQEAQRRADKAAADKARAEAKAQAKKPAAEPTPTPVVATPAPPAEPAAPATVQYVPGPLPKQDPETTAKQREALRQKLKELEVQPQTVAATPAATTPAPVTTSTPSEPAPVAVTTAPAYSASPQANQTASSTEQKKRAAEEANARKAAESQARADQESRRKADANQAYASKKTTAAGTETTFQPIAGPPLPLSADKQAQLTELLRKYRADEITPEQYHEERAKIVGTQ
jgi:colicin import membrane protein